MGTKEKADREWDVFRWILKRFLVLTEEESGEDLGGIRQRWAKNKMETGVESGGDWGIIR